MLDPGKPKATPAFPPELERAIFEIAAHTRPLSIPSFMLVACRVKVWVQPMLYQTIALSDGSEVGALNLRDHPTFDCNVLLPIMQSKSVQFPGRFVRNLLLSWIPHTEAAAVLSACRSIENLWINTNSRGKLFPLIEDLPLKRLYCFIDDLFGPERQMDFTHRIFVNMTHLEIFGATTVISPEMWTRLSLIPHLTHLGFKWPTSH
ncbi:hypothetical protein K438DRAFT_1863840 [Mycena galopus ATCC 62051]|nr:hypothetical protein K438DRAFT_1863834 [Mycena galopus ATCC 62051]KAF8153520.1 hypothetical protein K438DRAFT_1863840 [Mycena galopus ATCC 62051]